MEFQQLIKLIQTVSDSELTGFEYKENDVKVSMQADRAKIVQEGQVTEIPAAQASSVQILARQAADSLPEAEGKIIQSPLVGTFYAAPAEDAGPFVTVGDSVKKGQTLAIIEAMKLMNDIECEYDGTIEEIFVQNKEAVEYGQPLFKIS